MSNVKTEQPNKPNNILPDIIRTKGNITSFGGGTLVANLEKAETAIAKLEYTERIWDRSRSQWTLKHIVHSYSSDWKNLRQISAELQRKRDALREAKFRYAKELQKIEIKRAEILELEEKLIVVLDKEGNYGDISPGKKAKVNAKIKMIEIEIAEIETNAGAAIPKIEGALKEILTLEQMYDQLTSRMGELSEEEYERQEAISHMRHALDQAVRDVRAQGRIGQGVQEYLQQCGLNCTHVFNDIVSFLQQEGDASLTTEFHYTFLDAMSDKYKECAQTQAKLLGFSEEPITEITYNKERDER